MKRRPFFWHIFPSLLVIVAAACGVIILYATAAFRTFYHDQTESALKRRAVVLQSQFTTLLDQDSTSSIDTSGIDSLCKWLGARANTRVTIILPSGMVIGDSDEWPATMDNHRDRPEVIEALKGDTGVATRYSATLERDLTYVAVPMRNESGVKAVLRTSVPMVTISDALGPIFRRLALAGLAVVGIAVVFSLALSRRLSRPFEELRHGADRFARGDLSTPMPIPDALEAAELADAMNGMARQLDERIRTVTRQRNEQNAILSGMVEGVIAVDTEERILMVNAAAAKMLDGNHTAIRGKMIQEAVRNAELQMFLRELLSRREAMNREIRFVASNGGEHALEIQGNVLTGSKGGTKGALAVMHDVTDLKQLERIRRDFVANVSHELRTPLTSIKGFVETLLDGAIEEKQERVRFLDIIANHVNRLNSIIEDLLTISRLEKEETEAVELERASLAGIVREAVGVCSGKAQENGVSVEFSCNQETIVEVNSSLLEQAVINLVDNAVKYSGRGTKVRVTCTKEEKEVRIAVSDEGPGIESEHLPRIFERFYRVDKARSRKMGGTGLGLAIVKHIMNVHNGNASVESRVGKGTTFTLHVPVSR